MMTQLFSDTRSIKSLTRGSFCQRIIEQFPFSPHYLIKYTEICSILVHFFPDKYAYIPQFTVFVLSRNVKVLFFNIFDQFLIPQSECRHYSQFFFFPIYHLLHCQYDTRCLSPPYRLPDKAFFLPIWNTPQDTNHNHNDVDSLVRQIVVLYINSAIEVLKWSI